MNSVSAMTDVDAVISKAAEKFGVSELREKQYEAVRAFLCGNDVFLTVPTGYGKSIVYGILPFAFDIMKGKYRLELQYTRLI